MNDSEPGPEASTPQWDASLYRFHGGPHVASPPGTAPLPQGVRAIHGKDNGRRYLFRPGEVTCRREDLERYPRLAEILQERGARRFGPDDYAAYEWEQRPRDKPTELLAIGEVKRVDRRALADDAMGRAEVERFVVDALRAPDAPLDVPRFIEEIRREGVERWGEVWPLYPHTVLAGELGNGSYGPAEPPLPERTFPIPETVSSTLGEGVRVAVIDTGVWLQHEWLVDHCEARGPEDDEELDESAPFGTLDFEAGHGTFVAGIIRQYAPGARVIVRGTMDSAGTIDDATVAGSLYSLLDHDIDIVNLSLGGYTFASEPTGLPTTFEALRALRQKARDRRKSLFVVAAAGNHNRSERFYPAAWPDVIGVGALDRNFSKALFSNFGDWVNVWAPGVRLRSSFVGPDVTRPGGGSTTAGALWSGTSFATPVVAGTIAASMSR